MRYLLTCILLLLAAAGAAGHAAAQPAPGVPARTLAPIPGSALIPPFGSVTFSTGASEEDLTTSSSLEVDSDTPEPVTAGYVATGPAAGDGSLPGLLTLTAPDGAVVQIQSGCQPQGTPAQAVSCAVSAARAQGSGYSVYLTSKVWFMTLAAGASLPPGACPLPIPPYSNTPPPGPFTPGQPGVNVCDASYLGISAVIGPVGSYCFPPVPLSPGVATTTPPPMPSRVAVPGSVCLRDDSASVTFYGPRSGPASLAEVTVTAEGGGAGTTITFDDLGLAITSPGGPVIITTEPDPCQPSGAQFTTVVCPGATLDPPSSVEFTVDTTRPQAEHVLTAPPGWSLMGFPDGTILPRNWTAYTLDTAAPGGSYMQLPPHSVVAGGVGYWVDVSSGVPQRDLVPTGAATPQIVDLAPGRWALIGNPFNDEATVTGADVVEIYDPVTKIYRPVSGLYPGQGAWAYSAAGGTLTLSP